MDSDLAASLRPFFQTYLSRHRGVSPHTLGSYRDTFKLFLTYLQPRYQRALRITDLTPAAVLGFLQYLEDDQGRGNCAQTRNQRLAAIQGFFKYLSIHQAAFEPLSRRILAIPRKRAASKAVDSLNRQELEALFSQPSPQTSDGLRDLAILLFLYNTGARASEAAQARRLWFDFPNRLVTITGKGRKERLTPLWPPTVKLLELYTKEHRRKPKPGHHDFFFIDQRGLAFTRFGIRAVVKKHLHRAAAQCPSLAGRKLSTHSLRHTCASHLLEARVDPNVIKAWLGHASITSTDTYLHTDLNAKRRILEQFAPPENVTCILEPKAGQTAGSLIEWLKDL